MARDGRIDAATLKAANINPSTGLATDYLNHYNEVAMMIDMIADAPEMIQPVLDWRPVNYATHFNMTNFSDKDLAIEAYDDASPEVKERFAEARQDVELVIAEVQDMLEASPDNVMEAIMRAPDIFALIARVGAVINGETPQVVPQEANQADIDALFA